MVEDRVNFIDLLLKMFCYVPSKRITAAQALKHPFFKGIGKDVKSEQAEKILPIAKASIGDQTRSLEESETVS